MRFVYVWRKSWYTRRIRASPASTAISQHQSYTVDNSQLHSIQRAQESTCCTVISSTLIESVLLRFLFIPTSVFTYLLCDAATKLLIFPGFLNQLSFHELPRSILASYKLGASIVKEWCSAYSDLQSLPKSGTLIHLLKARGYHIHLNRYLAWGTQLFEHHLLGFGSKYRQIDNIKSLLINKADILSTLRQ